MQDQKMEFLTTNEVAELLRIKPTTLTIWRVRGIGPAYHKLGRRVVYRERDVFSWIDSQKHLSFDMCANH